MTSPPPRSGGPARASTAVLQLVREQLAEERATKTSLETRAVSVITTAGTLVTLLFALAALVTKEQGYELPLNSTVFLLLALAAFLVSASFALSIARPASFAEIDVESLAGISTPESMAASAEEADPKIAAALVEIIRVGRQVNAKKARTLRAAVSAELLGVFAVAVAVASALLA